MKGYLVMPIFNKLFRRSDRSDTKGQEMRKQLPAKMEEVAQGITFARTVLCKGAYTTAEDVNSLIEIGDSIKRWLHRHEKLLPLPPDDYNDMRRDYNKARCIWQVSEGTFKVNPLLAIFETMCFMHGGVVPETTRQVTNEEKIVRIRDAAKATYIFFQRIGLILQQANQRINPQSLPHQPPILLAESHLALNNKNIDGP